ncbi:MAG: crossover junction endodeoxyribonuclease RuvC [Hyphomicrobiaceae bacterium]
MSHSLIRIIGIDPGLRRTGWGIIDTDGVRLVYVASGVITSDGTDELAHRLVALKRGLATVIASFRPVEAAVEETFVNDNARATLKLGQARGIALFVPAEAGLKVAEYAPNQIKKTVTGVGHGEKRQVAMMVGLLLPKANPNSPDEADALAIAICHAQHRGSRSLAAALRAKEASL